MFFVTDPQGKCSPLLFYKTICQFLNILVNGLACYMLVCVCLQFKCPHYTRNTRAIKRYNWHSHLSPKGEHMNNMIFQVSTVVSVKVTVC
jgi:hypothetical protein